MFYLDPGTVRPARIGEIDGVEVALVVSGVIGIVGAVAAWFTTGRREPLMSVSEMQEERGAVEAPDPAETRSS